MFPQNMYPSSVFSPSWQGNLYSSNKSISSSSSTEINVKTDHDIMIRWKTGKEVDPRLLAMLELFGEAYEERHEFFNKIFRGSHEEVFKKVGNVLKRKKTLKKNRSMSRSLSMRTIERRGIVDESDASRLERFKIKTPNVIVDTSSAQGSQAATGIQSSSQDSK